MIGTNTSPLPVHVVRPKLTGAEAVAQLIGGLSGAVLGLALRAWIVMLLVPLFWQPLGFWTCVALVFGVRTLIHPSEIAYLRWTKAAR